jgi:glycosyltransferase involved in cell wall biosynthesis
MRIGVNCRRLVGQRLGIGRYLEYLLRYWSHQLEDGDHVDLYVPERIDVADLDLSSSLSLRPLSPPLTGILWENLVLPRAARSTDVLFGPSYTLPLTHRRPSVVATHSVNETEPRSHGRSYNFSYTPWYRRSARLATRVIVPSRSTFEDVQEHYGVPADRIDIVREGVDDAFRPVLDAQVLAETRIELIGADEPYVLFVGKLSQRRSIPTLMEAFARARAEHGLPHHLVLFGPNVLDQPLDEIAARLGITHHFVQTDGRISSHSELIPIYSAADLYVYPSLYDGYSLTTVEAMACGTPVITLNRAALTEIAEGAAYLLDDLSVEGLADAIQQVVTDRSLHADLRAKGLARAATLRWEDTAQGTLEVLRRVASP